MIKGKDVFIGKYSLINENVKIGKRSRVWNFCKLYGCQIGTNTEVGSYCEIKNNAKIGDNCIIKSYVSIASGTQIKDYVFIGPRVIFLNDKIPSVKAVLEDSWNLEEIIIEDEVTIGGGAIILPGLRIGKNSFIGAGSIVTKNIPPNEIWLGNPARFLQKKKSIKV